MGRLECYWLCNCDQYECYNFYVFIDGNEFFICGNVYFGGVYYYICVLEKGCYFFLVDWVYFFIKFIFVDVGIFFGKIVGIFIDMQMGMFQIVIDELIVEVLKFYLDFKKQYLFQNILDYLVQFDWVCKVIVEVNSWSQIVNLLFVVYILLVQ